MALSFVVLIELGLIYFLGATTGPAFYRLVLRRFRRSRRQREWDGYFQN